MYTRTFEADSLEEALKSIKQELGPDAIILKTVTNKGLKGAFKKKKIEITAAISEKNYVRKAQVDKALGENRDQFYQGSSSQIAEMIDQYGSPREGGRPQGYGNIALNRQVKKADSTRPSLESFLKRPVEAASRVEKKEEKVEITPAPAMIQQEVMSEDFELKLDEQQQKIDFLEAKLQQLIQQTDSHRHDQSPRGLKFLRDVLLTKNIDQRFVDEVIKSAAIELRDNELEDEELLFEYALSKVAKSINVGMPLFSRVDSHAVVTILIGNGASGQSSLFMKLGAMNKDAVLIQYDPHPGKNIDFTEKFLGLTIQKAKTLPEVVSLCREASSHNKNSFVDFSCKGLEKEETKKFLQSLKRSFENVEILLCLSAIHSEIYNKTVLRKFRGLVDALCVSYLDLTLNSEALLNFQLEETELPYYFFGTGEVIPEDIESATVERLIGSIFNLYQDDTQAKGL